MIPIAIAELNTGKIYMDFFMVTVAWDFDLLDCTRGQSDL